MNAPKFTKWPWTHYDAKLRPQVPLRVHAIYGANGEPIVKWGGFDGVDKQTLKANADLIAAAPELYAAVAYAIDNPEFDSAEFDRLGRAALAKAHGDAL